MPYSGFVVETPAAMVWDRGEEKPAKLRLAFADIGEVQLELIQILEGDSFHSEFLREHEPGIHNLDFRAKDSEAKLDVAKRIGLKILQAGPGGRFYPTLTLGRRRGSSLS